MVICVQFFDIVIGIIIELSDSLRLGLCIIFIFLLPIFIYTTKRKISAKCRILVNTIEIFNLFADSITFSSLLIHRLIILFMLIEHGLQCREREKNHLRLKLVFTHRVGFIFDIAALLIQ